MMKLIICFLSVCLLGCSSYSDKNFANQIDRKIASQVEAFSATNSFKKLTTFNTLLKKIYKTIPKTGEPIYYVYKNFYFTALKHLKKISSSVKDIPSTSFIPYELGQKTYFNFLNIIVSYKNFISLKKYLNNSQIVNQNSKKVKNLFKDLENYMAQYSSELLDKISNDDYYSNVKTLEEKYLYQNIRYLISKIKPNINLFLTTRSERYIAKKVFLRLETNSPLKNNKQKRKLKLLLKNYQYKILKRKLTHLSLPDSHSINGSEDSFEKVMSVQLSFELIDYSLKHLN